MQRHMTIAIIAVLATVLAGCDAIGEQLAEEAAQQVTGADIEVDDEGISVESSEGSFSANADGEVTMETDEGTFESSGELPEDFPGAVPLPEDGTLVNGSRLDGEDGLAWTVNFEYESGDPAKVMQAQVAALEDAGFTSESDFSMGDGSGGMSGAVFESDQFTVNISALGETDDFILGYQVFEKTEESSGDGS